MSPVGNLDIFPLEANPFPGHGMLPQRFLPN